STAITALPGPWHRILFLRAEDGIRDFHVTGVQTCALPISQTPTPGGLATGGTTGRARETRSRCTGAGRAQGAHGIRRPGGGERRSEERRVGKERRTSRVSQ